MAGLKKYVQLVLVLTLFFAAVLVQRIVSRDRPPASDVPRAARQRDVAAAPRNPEEQGATPSAVEPTPFPPSPVAERPTVEAPAPIPTSTSAPPPSPSPAQPVDASATPKGPSKGKYKDGVYDGHSSDAREYGRVRVEIVVENGRITDVVFLESPHRSSTAIRINERAMPLLKEEAIREQDWDVDVISGASASTWAFRDSLNVALGKAE